MKAAIVLALIAGCAGNQSSIFVRSIGISGFDLVIEQCTVSAHGDQLFVGGCETSRQRMPVIVDSAPGIPPLLDRQQVAAALSPIRPALVTCADLFHAKGSIR